MSLSDSDVLRVAGALANELTNKKRAQWIDPETHNDHHQWISTKQNNEQEWKRFRTKVLQSSLAWALPLVLGFICLAVWHQVVDTITKSSGG